MPVMPIPAVADVHLMSLPEASDDNEIWFDAREYLDVDKNWFIPLSASVGWEFAAGERAEQLIPFSEDCRRCAKRLLGQLAEIKQHQLLAACLTQLLPGVPGDILLAADSLYRAVTQKKQLDIAVIQALGLVSSYLLNEGNMISRLALYLRDSLSDAIGGRWLASAADQDGNHLFIALAVTAVVARGIVTDEGAPQRCLLRVPLFMGNLLIRASFYWQQLQLMAQRALAFVPAQVQGRAFEVDSTMERVNSSYGRGLLQAFRANSTVLAGSFIQATVSRKPLAQPHSAQFTASGLHWLAVDRLRRISGISDLLYCDTRSSETVQRHSGQEIVHHYFHTDCDALNSSSAGDPVKRAISAGYRRQSDIYSRHADWQQITEAAATTRSFYTPALRWVHRFTLLPGASADSTSRPEPSEPVSVYDAEGEVVALNNYYHMMNPGTARHFFDTGRQAIDHFYADYSTRFPPLLTIARQLLRQKIQQRFHLDLDPDQVFFMHFDYLEYDGDHTRLFGPPRTRAPLTRFLFNNFPAEIQNNLVDMDVMCGIYSGAAKPDNVYELSEKLKINPVDFINLIWEIDFYQYASAVKRAHFKEKDIHIKRYCYDLIIHLATSGIKPEAAKDVLAGAGLITGSNVTTMILDINGYQSSNIYIFRNRHQGRVTLYLPGSDFKFITFRTDFEMREWFTRFCASAETRAVISSHFPVALRQDGIFYAGVDNWLNSINEDNSYYYVIATGKKKLIAANFCNDMHERIRQEVMSDLDYLIKSDSEIKRDMWEGFIDASNIIPNPLSPFLSLGIHLEHAVEADSYEEKIDEWHKIKYDLVNLALMVLMDKAVKFKNDGYEFINHIKRGLKTTRINTAGLKAAVSPKLNRLNPSLSDRILVRRLLLRLAVSPEYVINSDENMYYFMVGLRNEATEIQAIKINKFYLPIRKNHQTHLPEVYDRIRPDLSGYPVFLNKKHVWQFGVEVKPRLKLSDSEGAVNSYVSDDLFKKITDDYYASEADLQTISPPDSRGIVKNANKIKYLHTSKGYVPITRHPLFDNVYQLGGNNVDKIFCRYDSESEKFVLISEENIMVDFSTRNRDPLNYISELQRQAMIRSEYLVQLDKNSYREGFRTREINEFDAIYEVDNKMEAQGSKVIAYGLDDEELSVNDNYFDVLTDIRDSVLSGYENVANVYESVQQVESNIPLRNKLAKIFEIDVEKDDLSSIKDLLVTNLDKIKREYQWHYNNKLREIWCVDFPDENVLGVSFINDPLRRVYINLKKSAAYASSRTTCLGCKPFGNFRVLVKDQATIIHELSHLSGNTIDAFYLQDNYKPATLLEKMHKLYSGTMSIMEMEAILDTPSARGAGSSSLTRKQLAAYLLKNYAQVRAEFMLNNADSLTHIILMLGKHLGGVSKRDLSSKQRLNLLIFNLFVAGALNKNSKVRS